MSRRIEAVVMFIVAVSGWVWLVLNVHAQERSPRQTLQWQLGEIHNDPANTVQVFDTQGVCLYVAVGEIGGYASGHGYAIAAVPKTQLPSGTGCQRSGTY